MHAHRNAIEWLNELVGIDTTSRNSNLELIELIDDYLSHHGVKTYRSSHQEGKANLFATFPAYDGSTQGGIVFSGHTDVVPVDGQNWDTNPFQVQQKGDLLYGRGTCDMKGFLACALALTPELLKQERKKPIHFAFSYDEEVGCVGAPYLIKELQERGQNIDGCIVGEPSNMQVVVAHKGINLFHCQVHGKAAHSSLTPQGCNAIEHAARLICRIRDLADYFKANGPFDKYYDVPYTTITSNRIQGGIAVNTIPELCEFNFEFRNLPGMPADTIQTQIESYINDILLPAMQKEHPEAKITLEKIAQAPGLEASEKAAFTELVRALTQDHETRKVAYATEAGLFEKANIPTIVCGPGSIEQAHKANEFVAISQLEKCEDFLRKVSETL